MCVCNRGVQDSRGTLYEHVEALWNGSLSEMAAGKYKPAVEDTFMACVRSLSWWKGTAAASATSVNVVVSGGQGGGLGAGAV